jgi:putative endopeptidase
MVTAPAYFEKLNELCVEENLPLIRDMLIVSGVVSEAGNLDRECYEWNVECRNTIRGSTGIMDDETAFSGRVSETLVWPVARLYTETYLKQEDKDRISAMTDEIMDAYHGILENADFLSDETRTKAVEKLDAMQAFILYPDDWSKYSCEELSFKSKEEGGTRKWSITTMLCTLGRGRTSMEAFNPPNTVPVSVCCSYLFFVYGIMRRKGRNFYK